MGVADAIASRYRRRGVADDDLQQVAYLALTKAARKFDPEAGHDFLSYAVPTIRGELRRYFRDSGWMVRPPRKVQELQSRIFAAQSELSLTLGRSPSPREVAAHLGEPVGDIEEALAAEGCFTPTSLDRSVTSDSELTVGDLLAGHDVTESAAEARVVLGPRRTPPERARQEGAAPPLLRRLHPAGDRPGDRRHPDPGVPAAEPDLRGAARRPRRAGGDTLISVTRWGDG